MPRAGVRVVRGRKPTPGRSFHAGVAADKLPPGHVVMLPSGFPGIRRESIHHLFASVGCSAAPSKKVRNGIVGVCQLCGPSEEPNTPCSQEKHDAYYDALEKGEREPIEWEGDVRRRDGEVG